MRRTERMVMVALCALLYSAAGMAAESGTMSKDDELKAEPYRDAKTVQTLAVGQSLSIVKKQGGWLNVKVGKVQGWVKMLSVKRGSAAKAGKEASGLLALSSGRAGTGKVVATTGVRGLNEEELKAAAYNAQELQLAESYAADKAAAQQFAKQGKLVARPFDYLPAVK